MVTFSVTMISARNMDLFVILKSFITVVNAIPKSIVFLLKDTLSHYSVTLSLPSLRLDTLSIRDQKCTNMFIRSIFIQLYPNRLIFLRF